MGIGKSFTHTFVIRNDGAAPLKLTRGPTTCQCTSAVLGVSEVQPGSSAEIEMTWRPGPPVGALRQSARIFTNDPENKTIDLEVTGSTVFPVELIPSGPDGKGLWGVGVLREGRPATFRGYVVSREVEQFEIESLTSASPSVEATPTPVAPEQLSVIGKGIRSAYSVDVTVAPDLPIGRFTLELRIKTDADVGAGATSELVADVSGMQIGPISLFGPYWVESSGAVSVGQIDPLVGKSIVVTLFVKSAPEEGLKIISAEAPEFFQFELERDPKLPDRRYALNLKLLPMPSDKSQLGRQAHRVKLQTNHPRAPSVEFDVVFSI